MSIETDLSRLLGDLPVGISEGVALGTGLADGYDLYESPIGEVAVFFNPRGVSAVDVADDGLESRFVDRFGRRSLRAEAPSAWRRLIEPAIEKGRPGELPVDLGSVTDFQAEVLRMTATIPQGEVRPYAWLAHEVRRPGAVRAVGSTMARNPVPLIIPCHRVVRSDGHIGAYSLGGAHNKQELLEHEGVEPEWLEDLASRNIRLRANTSTGIFCNPTCGAIRRSKESNVVDLHSMDEALEAGFRPCKLCKPH